MPTRRKATTTGGLIKTSLQFAPGEMDRIDKYAAQRGCSRSLAVCDLVEKGFRLLKIERAGARKAVRDSALQEKAS